MWKWYAKTSGRKALGTAAVVVLLIFTTSGRQPNANAQDTGQTESLSESQTLSPAGQAELKTILSAAKLSELHWPNFSNYKTSVAELYHSMGDCLVWTANSEPTPQSLAITRVLENADQKGLDPADYDGPEWVSRIANLERPPRPSESDLIRFDVALTVSVMRYVSDLHIGRVDPRFFHSGFEVERNRYNLAQFLLNRIVSASNIQPALAEVEPTFPAYQRTLEALHKYQKLASEYHGQRFVVPKKTVDPGDSYSELPQLAHLLRLLGDLPTDTKISASGRTYQGPFVNAIKRFQKRHGLDADGRIGPQTFRQLNTPIDHRVMQLRLSLERWRWLPHQFEQPPIIVNIPEFQLHVIDAQRRLVFSTKVVVGKAYGRQTPVFANKIRSVVFRPYWDVPYSIQRNELVPDIRKDPGYLKEHDYEVVDSRRRVVSEGEVNAKILKGLRSGTLFARQRPGPHNALGLLKFDLPNHYSVYLHDTPSTSLFSKSRRDFSHGCIRVENPVELAAWLLRDKPGWTTDRIREAMNGDKTFRVDLAKPVPILIVYGTAIVAENGEPYFFRDIYGLDAELEKALASGHPYAQAAGGSGR